jgi:hypothetical protein
MSDDWKDVIWSDELSFTLYTTLGFVCVWRMPKEACNNECLVSTVKHGGRYVMIWTVVSWYTAGPIIMLNDQIMPVTMWTF